MVIAIANCGRDMVRVRHTGSGLSSGSTAAMISPASAALGMSERNDTTGSTARTASPVTTPLQRVRAPESRLRAERENEPPTG